MQRSRVKLQTLTNEWISFLISRMQRSSPLAPAWLNQPLVRPIPSPSSPAGRNPPFQPAQFQQLTSHFATHFKFYLLQWIRDRWWQRWDWITSYLYFCTQFGVKALISLLHKLTQRSILYIYQKRKNPKHEFCYHKSKGFVFWSYIHLNYLCSIAKTASQSIHPRNMGDEQILDIRALPSPELQIIIQNNPKRINS